MIVAYCFTHNEGLNSGILNKPGDSVVLTDLFEGDGEIRAFVSVRDAQAWLSGEIAWASAPAVPTDDEDVPETEG